MQCSPPPNFLPALQVQQQLGHATGELIRLRGSSEPGSEAEGLSEEEAAGGSSQGGGSSSSSGKGRRGGADAPSAKRTGSVLHRLRASRQQLAAEAAALRSQLAEAAAGSESWRAEAQDTQARVREGVVVMRELQSQVRRLLSFAPLCTCLTGTGTHTCMHACIGFCMPAQNDTCMCYDI